MSESPDLPTAPQPGAVGLFAGEPAEGPPGDLSLPQTLPVMAVPALDKAEKGSERTKVLASQGKKMDLVWLAVEWQDQSQPDWKLKNHGVYFI